MKIKSAEVSVSNKDKYLELVGEKIKSVKVINHSEYEVDASDISVGKGMVDNKVIIITKSGKKIEI